MRTQSKMFGLLVFLGILLLALPASAGLYTILPGGTVFVGERNLDVSQTGLESTAKIGWFGSTGNSTPGAPLAKATVEDAKNFYIDPSIFSGRTGPWYNLSSGKVVFEVQEPELAIHVVDETTGKVLADPDIGVPKGNDVGFQVETNLVAIGDRPGLSGVPITIVVQTPGGNQLSQVSDYGLVDMVIDKSPFYTGPVWETDAYALGPYKVWAYCNVNGMKDNYPVEGKTETPNEGSSIQIMAKTAATAKPVSLAATGSVVTMTLTAAPASEPVTPQATSAESPSALPTRAPAPGTASVLCVLGLSALLVWGRTRR